jgi:hypothetical protein
MLNFILPLIRSRSALLLFIFLLYTSALLSQQTKNVHPLDTLKAYVEKNYVGFADKVNAQTQKAYLAHTKQSYTYAKQAVSAADQYFAISHYLTFFKDNHLYINSPADTAHIEKIQLDNNRVQQLYHTGKNSIEGIYYTGDSVYKVAVIKSKKGLRSYVGIILTSQAASWKKGQVKFELIETGINQYLGRWYNRAHDLILSHVHFNTRNGLGDAGWYKHGSSPEVESAPVTTFAEESKANTFFRILNDSTCYLRIKSFDGRNARKIDSVINANKKTLQSKPRLIIDVRGNGGGSDHSVSFLKPILYTNPVKNIGIDMLFTPDNIAAWDTLIEQYRNDLPKDYLDNISKKIHKHDGTLKALVNYANDYTDTLPMVWPTPAKVAIVIDGGCASSTEEFLLFARQSKKTIMAGEPSRGVLDYSNTVPKNFSNPAFTLHYPTSRSRRIDAGLAIDNKGIQPDIKLNLNGNWLNELMKKW